MGKGREGSQAIDDPDDAVAHVRDIEIQQVTKLKATKPEITQRLGPMDGEDGFKRLQFDDNQITYQEINSVTVIDGQSLITKRDHYLPADR
jgi:hypothetical protein